MECKAGFQKLAKPVSRDWLYEQYVTLGKDCPTIAREVNRDPKSVWNWLKDFGIPTRPRGSNVESLPKGRAPGFKLSQDQRQKIREARLRDGHVPYMKNGQHWLKVSSKESHPRWQGGITPDRQKFYASAEWQAVARKVWRRDRSTCQRCGKKHNRGEPFDIHHIVSFGYEPLRCELSNLVLLCESCHYWIHGSENKERKFINPWPS